jgi:hypothetical protein
MFLVMSDILSCTIVHYGPHASVETIVTSNIVGWG